MINICSNVQICCDKIFILTFKNKTYQSRTGCSLSMATEVVTMKGLAIFSAFSLNNAILSVVVVAIVLGFCMRTMGQKAGLLKSAFGYVQTWIG